MFAVGTTIKTNDLKTTSAVTLSSVIYFQLLKELFDSHKQQWQPYGSSRRDVRVDNISRRERVRPKLNMPS